MCKERTFHLCISALVLFFVVVEVRVINTTESVEDQVFPASDSFFPTGSWASGGSFISLTGKTVRQFEVAGK